MIIKITELQHIVKKTLLTQYTEEFADLITDVVIYGETCGRKSHGILRLLKQNFGVFVDTIEGKPEYVRKTKASTVINGKGNPGMLVAPLAMKEVIKLGKENGIGIVGTFRSINSTGCLSYYCEQIANQNLIAVVMAHSSLFIAPYNSKKALFGTNPIAFGLPSHPSPLIFDMSTAAITFGEIAKLKSEGKKLPPDVAIDKKGTITTDPSKAMDGALLSFHNSYKGSGLAMMVELLAGMWPGASYGGINQKDGWGNLYMAFSPDLLGDLETFKQKTHQLVETLKHIETRDGREVRIPGEHTTDVRNQTLMSGVVEINEEVLHEIKSII